MATESPMRMVESSQARKWFSSKDASVFRSSFKSKATEESVLFLKGQQVSQGKASFIPSRSGSAPPSMEGSVAAVGNVLSVKDSSMSSNSDSLSNALENRKSEGQCSFEPSYAAYYVSNVNLNPKLPSQHLRSQTSSCKENQGPHRQGSLEEASLNLFEDINILKPGQNTALLSNRHKSLVDLIQEDFPRTPSPVYNQSHLPTDATVEDSIDLDAHAVPSGVSSIHISNLSDSATNSASAVQKDSLNLDSSDLISNDEVPPEAFPNMLHSDGNKRPSEDQTCSKDAGFKDNVSTNEFMHTEKQKARAYKAEARRHKREEQYYVRNNLNQSFTNGCAYQIPGAGAQVLPHGMNNSQSYFGKLGHSHAQFSLRIQPSMSSPGLTGSLCASPAAFMTPGDPFYPNFLPSGLFAPQHSSDGYAVSSSIFPPYMAGYSSQGTVSLPFEIAYGPNLNGQATTVSSGDRVPYTGDFQNQTKYYDQLGLTLQPSYVEPHMQYYPHSFYDTYPAALQQNQLPSRKLTGEQFSSVASQQTSDANACLDGQKFQPPINGGLTNPSVRNMGLPGGSYFGNSSSMDVMMQFPALSLGSPILPSSPMGGSNPLGGQNEMKIPLVSRGNGRFSSGQRGFRSFGDPKKQSVIEELRSIDSEKFELSDIAGRIVEFSIDQHGSRFIQQKLESCSAEERTSVFEEILPHASKLMTDVFGNYVIQKFFAHGSPDQRKKLAEQLSGDMLSLSLQMYGCRVIQKVLEVIELDQKVQLVQELDGHVMRCVHDQNGNHVIQKCIECIPIDKIQFIISAFQGQVQTLSTHPYGCRVIQRVLERCSDEQNIQCIVDEILESAYVLAQDQYGNYVTQHVLERGTPHERSQIISKLAGKIVQLSQHKYASNVIEKCWEHSNEIEREAFIEEVIQQPSESGNLLTMMKDQYANYVVQKILETSNDKYREILLSHIRVHLHALKKYTYGKHIVARFEQLAGPGNEAEEV